MTTSRNSNTRVFLEEVDLACISCVELLHAVGYLDATFHGCVASPVEFCAPSGVKECESAPLQACCRPAAGAALGATRNTPLVISRCDGERGFFENIVRAVNLRSHK
ncbi:hypothetical protein [Variovorax paradoxus]|uniref:hypothetical protein n=1 Tax=Variovorax paradoxus TaxID=34073 RepID=UPI003D65D05C